MNARDSFAESKTDRPLARNIYMPDKVDIFPDGYRGLARLSAGMLWCGVIAGLVACSSGGYVIQKGSIATLDSQVELEDVELTDATDEAIRSYAGFLENADDAQLTPEAIRRLADLQIERGVGGQSGRLSDKLENNLTRLVDKLSADISNDELGNVVSNIGVDLERVNRNAVEVSAVTKETDESLSDFERRTTANVDFIQEEEDSLVNAQSTIHAIKLYKILLRDFPDYPRTDQVLYQLSRAYEELGDIDTAIEVLGELVYRFPESRYMPESNFRRGEYFFLRSRYFKAEESYQAVIDYGIGSQFYEHSLYKQGWTKFKQTRFKESLIYFFAMLDLKLFDDFEGDGLGKLDSGESQRIEDTFRSISLTFSYIGGPAEVSKFFLSYGARSYQSLVYSHFGEFYLSKNRYGEAADAYRHFIRNQPIHFQAPFFQIRIIEIFNLGGFLSKVVEEKKVFARDYHIQSRYWTFYDINQRPKVVEFARNNLIELATHYHALYQFRLKNKSETADVKEPYSQAVGWYRVSIQSFPTSREAPKTNYNLAELYFQGKQYILAAKEFRQTAYHYDKHQKSADAAFFEVVSLRRHLSTVGVENTPKADAVQDDIIESSIRFAHTYPEHRQASLALIATTEDLFKLKRYEKAITEARFAILAFGERLDDDLRFSMWRVVAYSAFDLSRYTESEAAFVEALKLAPRTTAAEKAEYDNLVDNLGASVYRQAEGLRTEGRWAEAAQQFLRVGVVAPDSKYRVNADFDAASVYIRLEQWQNAITILLHFRRRYPNNILQNRVTRNLAVAYKESEQLILAAQEFERVEVENDDEDLRREALLEAASLYNQANQEVRSIAVYEKYVEYFPKPFEFALETRQHIADVYRKLGNTDRYRQELETIIRLDKNAGEERTDRTRFLAANAGIYFAVPLYEQFSRIKLTIPLEKSLAKKQESMEKTLTAFTELTDYKIAKITSAATYYIASIYKNMADSLLDSEPPAGLSELELEEYQILIEDQAFPFEDNAVVVFEKNIELLELGVYDEWVKKSLVELAKLLPLQYAKYEKRPEIWEQIL